MVVLGRYLNRRATQVVVQAERVSYGLQDLVERDNVVPLVRTLLGRFKTERTSDESFGDWCTRQGVASLCGTLGLALPKAV